MESILKKICQLAASGERETQFAALRVLASLNIKDREVARLLGEILEKTTDPALRDLILEIPAKAGFPTYLPYLVPCLGNTLFNREKVVRAVSAIGVTAIPVLEKRYSKASEYEKESILTILGRIPSKKSTELLLYSLLDSQQTERLKLICGLLRGPIEKFKNPEKLWFKKTILKQLAKPQVKKSSSLTVSHLILLGYLRDASLKPFLLKTLNETNDPFVKKFVLITLSQLGLAGKGHDDLVKGLMPTLSHADFPNIVKNSIMILERLEISKKMQGEISKLLENPHPSVRSFALSKLGSFETGENVTTLLGYLDSTDHRIREAAKTSLEKMPKAAKALLARFEASTRIDQMNQLANILKQHKKFFTPALSKKMFLKMEKLGRNSNQIYREYLALLRNVNPDFLFKEVFNRVNSLKKKKKWDDVIQYLNLLEGSFLFNQEARYELAIARLKMSKTSDFTQGYRDQNQGLSLIQGLVRSDAENTYKRLLKEKALKPEDKYYIGFHFAEKQLELREFGLKLLKVVSRTKNKLGKQARQKLSMLIAV